MSKILNVNVGILGHVDSGKTSLSKALSTLASTNAFDKSPQSQERGITLDLGFSACIIDPPKIIQEKGYEKVQYTLVDCPGHASLIRTIIGGAQIIDIMILVIDVGKGIQTQTAECIVIGEITTDKLIVVLNKIDIWEEDVRQKKIEKLIENLNKTTFAKTKFKNPPMIPISVNPKNDKPIGLDTLINEFEKNIPEKKDVKNENMLMAVDHCFSLKGKGTILTGTVMKGKISVNQDIEIPTLGEKKKVKSIQMFKSPVDSAQRGDRIGVCLTQFDATKFERGFVSEIGTVPVIKKILCRVEKIRFYKEKIKNKSRFHISVGHSTVMGDVKFFHSQDEKVEITSEFNPKFVYSYCDELSATKDGKVFYCVIELAQQIPIPVASRLIASKLDTDINAAACRLAFHGVVLPCLDFDHLNVIKKKEKIVGIDRWVDDSNLIGKDLVKKGGDLSKYINLKIDFETEEKAYQGVIESSFGTSGKFKVAFRDSIGKDAKGTLKIHYSVNMFEKNRKWLQ